MAKANQKFIKHYTFGINHLYNDTGMSTHKKRGEYKISLKYRDDFARRMSFDKKRKWVSKKIYMKFLKWKKDLGL